MLWAKVSTAATLIIGPILDSAGAEYTSAVIGDISLSKNGGTLTALASAATLTHIANGQYTLVLTTGNTDTLGRAQFTCNKSTYQMPPLELMVIPTTVYDALVTNATTAAGGLGDIQRVAGTAQTAGDIIGKIGPPFAGVSGATVGGNLTDIYNLASSTNALFLGITGTVDSTGATTTSFRTNVTSADGYWDDATLVFTSGALVGQARVIASFANTNGLMTFDEAFTAAPANGVTFDIRSGHTHTKTQIATAVRDVSNASPAGGSLGAAINTIDDLLDTEVAAIYSRIGAPAGASIAADIAAVPTAAANADALLGRNVAGGSSTGRTVSQAFFALRNKVAIVAGTGTVYSTDDTTASWTFTTTTDSAADPLTAIDPA